jgi:D-glycero-alpha-D-manno-heptose 1-phosphate guanylyltransferase
VPARRVRIWAEEHGADGGQPFLDYLLRWLRSEGVEEVVLCVGYKRTHIQRYVGKGRKWGLRVAYSIERNLLGTGGAVKKAEQLIRGERQFVINGDTFLEVKLKELIRFHRSRRGLATLSVVKVADSQRYGSLRVEAPLESTWVQSQVDKDLSLNGVSLVEIHPCF